MKLEDILRLDRTPFPCNGAIDDQERKKRSMMLEESYTLLFLEYVNRFAKQCGIPFNVQRWKYYVNLETDKAIYVTEGGRFSQYNQDKENTFKCILQDVMKCCGWECHAFRVMRESIHPDLSINDEILLEKPGFFLYNWNELCELNKQGYTNITLFFCLNKRIYDYKWYCLKNRKSAEKYLGYGIQVFEELLKGIADPLKAAFPDRYRGYRKEEYIMAFFTASHFYHPVEFIDLDFNFPIRMMILHLLLEYAEKMPGYKEELHGTMDRNHENRRRAVW